MISLYSCLFELFRQNKKREREKKNFRFIIIYKSVCPLKSCMKGNKTTLCFNFYSRSQMKSKFAAFQTPVPQNSQLNQKMRRTKTFQNY